MLSFGKRSDVGRNQDKHLGQFYTQQPPPPPPVKRLPYIPLEILPEIFSYLPVSSIGRFRSTSKTLLRMLSERDFIKKHLKSRKEKHLMFIKDLKSIYTNPLNIKGNITPTFHFTPFPGHHLSYVGSSSGLVLFEVLDSRDGASFCLVNLKTKKSFCFSDDVLDLHKGFYPRSPSYNPAATANMILFALHTSVLWLDFYMTTSMIHNAHPRRMKHLALQKENGGGWTMG